jgi:type VI secretion system protein ImpA
MAVLDLGTLLAPISDAAPSGPNLEYDPAFAALERAAEGRPEQAMGGVITPAEPPEWGAVLEKGVELLGRTKDLRVAVHVTRSLLHRRGIGGFVEGLALIRGLLENQWGSLHPELDPDDNNDATMRVTALAALTVPGVLMALRMTPLLESRVLGPVSLVDIAPPDGAPDNARIQGAFADAELPALEASLAALASGSSHLQGIDAVFAANGGGPDIAPLQNYFSQARQALEPRVAERRPVDGAAAAGNGAPVDGAAPSAFAPARAPGGDILSREDVVRALDKISAYYQRYEPSSPVPLVLERCRRLVTMSFLEILTELAPDGLRQAELVTGKTNSQ